MTEVREPDGDAPPRRTLAVQSAALDPDNGGRMIGPGALQAGDILLSAGLGMTSASIRLMSLSPVSHAALYIGEERVVEAIGSGVRARSIAAVLDEEAVVVAFRDPRLTAEYRHAIVQYALQQVGQRYDHLGAVLQAMFSLERRACEVPFAPALVRGFCIRGIATIQLGAFSNDRFFCSQSVLEAYRQAGLPLTDAAPRWLSPVDILHMREGDVPSVRVRQALTYVAHLKYTARWPMPVPNIEAL